MASGRLVNDPVGEKNNKNLAETGIIETWHRGDDAWAGVIGKKAWHSGPSRTAR